MTLTTIFAIAFTNGGLATWTLSEMIPFVLPDIIGNFTLPKLMAIIAFYK